MIWISAIEPQWQLPLLVFSSLLNSLQVSICVVKHWHYPRRGLALPSAPGWWSQSPLSILSDKSISVYLGALATLDSLTVWFIMGAWGHTVSAWPLEGMETKGQPPCLCDGASLKFHTEGLGMGGFPGWRYSMHIVTCHCWKKLALPTPPLGGKTGSSKCRALLDSVLRGFRSVSFHCNKL